MPGSYGTVDTGFGSADMPQAHVALKHVPGPALASLLRSRNIMGSRLASFCPLSSPADAGFLSIQHSQMGLRDVSEEAWSLFVNSLNLF